MRTGLDYNSLDPRLKVYALPEILPYLSSLAEYNYPSIVKLMGGSDKMIEMLNKSTEEMKGKGISIDKVTVEEPSEMIVYGKELQAAITQHTEIRMPKGIFVVNVHAHRCFYR